MSLWTSEFMRESSQELDYIPILDDGHTIINGNLNGQWKKLPIIVRLPQLSYHLLTMAHVYYFVISGICIKTTTVPEIGPLQLFIGNAK